MIGRLTPCSHVGRLRGIKEFAVDKRRSATPIRPSLLSTVEAVATLVIKRIFRKLFACNITARDRSQDYYCVNGGLR